MLRTMLLLSAVTTLGFATTVNPAPTPNPGPAPQEAAPPAASAPAKNPVKSTAESQAKAKKMYGYDCAMCHGATGDGKTDLAKDMSLTLGDWTDGKSLSAKTDGELFDLIRKGKDKMPPEGTDRAKDDDVWNLVIYIRGLAAKGGAPAAAAGK